jgi:hypothetical protein
MQRKPDRDQRVFERCASVNTTAATEATDPLAHIASNGGAALLAGQQQRDVSEADETEGGRFRAQVMASSVSIVGSCVRTASVLEARMASQLFTPCVGRTTSA